MYLKVKSKKIKNLSLKISKAKNDLVVKILNKKGYECNESQISQIKANRKLNTEQKKSNIRKSKRKSIKNWKLLYLGSRCYCKDSRQSNRRGSIDYVEYIYRNYIRVLRSFSNSYYSFYFGCNN